MCASSRSSTTRTSSSSFPTSWRPTVSENRGSGRALTRVLGHLALKHFARRPNLHRDLFPWSHFPPHGEELGGLTPGLISLFMLTSSPPGALKAKPPSPGGFPRSGVRGRGAERAFRWPLPPRSVPETGVPSLPFPSRQESCPRSCLSEPNCGRGWQPSSPPPAQPSFSLVAAATPHMYPRNSILPLCPCVPARARGCACVPLEGAGVYLFDNDGGGCVGWGGGPSVWCYPCRLFPHPHPSLPSPSAALHAQACG